MRPVGLDLEWAHFTPYCLLILVLMLGIHLQWCLKIVG
jgi:hypothetical protein